MICIFHHYNLLTFFLKWCLNLIYIILTQNQSTNARRTERLMSTHQHGVVFSDYGTSGILEYRK